MASGGTWSMHLGAYNRCSLPQVPALAHANRSMTLQYSNWKNDNHLASSKTSFFSNDLFLFISGLCVFHSHQGRNRLIVAADSESAYYSVIGISEIVSAYWNLTRQYHLGINKTLRKDVKLETLTKIDQCVPLIGKRKSNSWVCFAGGPRPRKPRVWKSRIRRGTVSKAAKLVDCVKALSNIKEEVYGALDSFIAWELEFPLITVKKALKTLRAEKEWKRIIQVFADMEELGIKPDYSSVMIIAKTFKNLGMLDKYDKVLKKYPQPDQEYRYYKGKRIKVRVQKTHDSEKDLIPLNESNSTTPDKDEDASKVEDEGESIVYPFFANEGIQKQMEISQPLQEREIMLE